MKRLAGIPFRLSKAMSRRNLYRWLDDHFASVQQGQDLKVLNIGAAGPIPERLKSNPALRVTNIDIDPAKEPDIVCDACAMESQFGDGVFDCVVAMEVLEHIPRPDMALAEIGRVLRSGGWAVVSTPFLFPLHAEPHDYWRFTRHGLSYLLRDFSDVKIRERTLFAESIAVLVARLGTGHTGWRRIAGVFLILLAALVWPAAFVIDLAFRDSRATTGYFVTARKR